MKTPPEKSTLGILAGLFSLAILAIPFLATLPDAQGQTGTNAERYYNQALKDYNAGNLEGALSAAKKALEQEPNSPKAFNYLGIIQKKMGNLENAATYFKKALKADPKFAPAHSNLGMVYLDQGKIDEAIKEHEEAIAVSPRSAEYLNNLALET